MEPERQPQDTWTCSLCGVEFAGEPADHCDLCEREMKDDGGRDWYQRTYGDFWAQYERERSRNPTMEGLD